MALLAEATPLWMGEEKESKAALPPPHSKVAFPIQTRERPNRLARNLHHFFDHTVPRGNPSGGCRGSQGLRSAEGIMRSCILHVTDHEYDQVLQLNHDAVVWHNSDRELLKGLEAILGSDIADEVR
jgi:hypothetical protein